MVDLKQDVKEEEGLAHTFKWCHFFFFVQFKVFSPCHLMYLPQKATRWLAS